MIDKQRIVSIALTSALIISFVVVLFLARGYRIDFTGRQIQGTGILSATSIPEGAMVYINDKAYTATNTSIGNIKPGVHTIRIHKQGYHTWKKEVTIQKELVSEVHALLTPLFPELKPLTFTGAHDPLLSPDGLKIAYTATTDSRNAIWVLDLTDRPFNLANRPRQVISDTKEDLFSTARKEWSPDGKSLLLTLNEKSYLLNIDSNTITPIDNIKVLRSEWKKEVEIEKNKNLQGLSIKTIEKIGYLNDPVWSPDRNVILHWIEEDGNTVYKTINLKPVDTFVQPTPANDEELNPYEEHVVYKVPENTYADVSWYPDSKHLFILEKEDKNTATGRLSLVQINGKNRQEFFSGLIRNNFVAPFINGAKVVILTSFNPEKESYNLYSVSLR